MKVKMPGEKTVSCRVSSNEYDPEISVTLTDRKS